MLSDERIDGSATFTTVLSSMIMNNPTETAPSVNHFLFSSVTKRCIETHPLPSRKLAPAKLANANGPPERHASPRLVWWQPMGSERHILDRAWRDPSGGSHCEVNVTSWTRPFRRAWSV